MTCAFLLIKENAKDSFWLLLGGVVFVVLWSGAEWEFGEGKGVLGFVV